MTIVYTITQRDIDSQGYRGTLHSPERRRGVAVKRMLGRYEQSDLGRQYYFSADGRPVLLDRCRRRDKT